MSNHEKAKLTYEALKKRKAAKARRKDIDTKVAISNMYSACMKVSRKKNVQRKAAMREW